MKLDSANRSFLALMILALLLGMYVLCGAVGSVLVPLVLIRVSQDGLRGLAVNAGSLLPVLLFVVLVAVGLALGARSLARQILASHRLARRVRGLALAPPEELAGVATDVGLGGRVVLLDSPEWFSFAYGVLTPRVAVSSGLLQGVSAVELRAVLEHERYHVCNLDPLKTILVQTLSAAFFFLPALDSLRLRYVAGRELAADRRAVRACGRRPLAGALLKVVRGPQWSELEVAAAIGGPDLLDARVAQLERGKQPKLVVPSFRAATLSLVGAALFSTTFLASVSSFGGPAAVHQATGTGVSSADLLGGLTCAVPFAGAGLVAYCLLAQRASRPLTTKAGRWRNA
ncbi:MAG TPA: M56 family metallopeptidase [Solirubrobacteraceae bacterium]